ncbi:glycosyltransferase family 2 protein [Halomonas sp. M5N1S17]|uniref:glycosyltransferase family 2 protein n=1 Tax=Halomonas alkalisoli TaxID=2907158 RepID=UPI001F452394|nr:glycosyltransferase family 2 protein [Halomonas alkalisoli]MCE9662262.1 glycosyltransferase family 2 protein [Halomonas alkalisoli]
MREPTISIVIPAYNVAPYIDAAFDTLASQTVRPYQVIIVDDGSVDETWERIRAYPHPYRTELISTENRGQGRARNLGITRATGTYIYFFDADDLLEPNFIERMQSVIETRNYPDIIFFSGATFFDEGAERLDVVGSYQRGFDGEYVRAVDLLAAFEKHGGGTCSPCLYISRRTIWSEKLRFKEHYHEDEEIFYPLIFSARRYVVTDDVFFQRRIRHGSTMTIPKNMKHVKGLHQLLESLLMLYRNPSYRDCRHYIRRRAIFFTGKYMSICRKAGVRYDLSLLMTMMLGFRNRWMLVKIAFHALSSSLRVMIKRYIGKSRLLSH